MKLILLRNVDDYGQKGQVVDVFFHDAYKHLLLPKFAVYHSEENVETYKDIIIPQDVNVYSSESAQVFTSRYSKRVFDICMNMEVPWTIQLWHIKALLRLFYISTILHLKTLCSRKHKVWVKSEDIEIPGGQIEGPNMALENKEFIAVMTINSKEKLKLRCRIHHIGEDAVQNRGWYIQQAEPVWETERLAVFPLSLRY